jgi:hypothetical protein
MGKDKSIPLLTDILNFDIGICLIEDGNNLCFGKSRFFHLSLLVRALCQKALLLKCKLLGEAYDRCCHFLLSFGQRLIGLSALKMVN